MSTAEKMKHCKNRRLSLRWFEPGTCHTFPVLPGWLSQVGYD